MSRIQIKHLSKKFDDTLVLKHINFNVAEGEMVSLVGPSGSGKTTLLRLLAGLVEPTEGQVIIDGKNSSKMSSVERGTIIVFQDFALFPHMTVIENIAFGLKVRGVSVKTRNMKASELVKLLQMEGLEERYPKELSGGQKQRVAIARALAVKPNVLLLDEPFSSLDTHLRHSMRELIAEVQRKLGITTILVTHDTEEALMISDRVAVLMDGEVVQFDFPRVIYQKPLKRSIADFFGDNNTLDVKVHEGKVFLDSLTIVTSSEYSGSATLVFRREAINIYHHDQMPLKGIIKESTYTGKSVLYRVETGLGVILVTQDAQFEWGIGQKVSLHLPESEALIYRNDTGDLL